MTALSDANHRGQAAKSQEKSKVHCTLNKQNAY